MTFNGENFFDVKAIANVTMLIAPEEFSCELDIPEANYTARKEAIYYPGEWNLNKVTPRRGCCKNIAPIGIKFKLLNLFKVNEMKSWIWRVFLSVSQISNNSGMYEQ